MRIGTFTSPKSVAGLSIFERSFSRAHSVTRIRQIEAVDVNDFDLFFLHNTLKVPDEVLNKSVVYLVNALASSVCAGGEAYARIRSAPPLAIWCTVDSIRNDLAKIGVIAETVHRPAPNFTPPDLLPPANFAVHRKIMWYLKPDHPPMKKWASKALEILNSISGVEIFVFPVSASELEINNPCVKVVGRVNLDEWAQKVDGLVRISSRHDFGRSTYEFTKYGKWALYLDSEDRHVHSIDDLDAIPNKIFDLLDYDSVGAKIARYDLTRRLGFAERTAAWNTRINAVTVP